MLLTQGFSQGQPLTSGNDGDKVSCAAESQGRQRPDPGYRGMRILLLGGQWLPLRGYPTSRKPNLGTIRREMHYDAYKDGSVLLTCRRWPSLGGLRHA